MKIIAIIPVKEISERVKNKNFRKFYLKNSLFDILIRKLKKCKEISNIYISSNSKKVKKLSNKHGCVYIERDIKFCNNLTPWSDVIYEVAKSIPEKNDTILMWCHTTTPLFDSYQEAIRLFKKKSNYDGLISVENMKRFLISHTKKPINYTWGVWHPYSQDLDPVYSVTGALFMSKKENFIKNRYVISKKPQFLETKAFESIDIDTIEDFKLAQLIYRNKKN
jgi:N-acylneuraminate cytidylyltransferase